MWKTPMGNPPGVKYGGFAGLTVLQISTPLALSMRASARFITRRILPCVFSIGVPPVVGSNSIEPRFCAAVAVVSVLVQVIGLMARPPGSRTGFVPSTVGASVFQETMTPVSLAPLANFRWGFRAR